MSPHSRYVTVSNPRCGCSGAPFASPGATSIGPISSSNRNGSKSENEALGNGRRTRNPPPSKVSILLTIPATVRPSFVCFSSVLNAFLAIDISISPLLQILRHLRESRSVVLDLSVIGSLVANLFQQANQCRAFLGGQRRRHKSFKICSVLRIGTRNQFL